MEKENLLQKANTEELTKFRVSDRELENRLNYLLMIIVAMPGIVLIARLAQGKTLELGGSFLFTIYIVWGLLAAMVALITIFGFHILRQTYYLIDDQSLKITRGEKITGTYDLAGIKKFLIKIDKRGEPVMLVLGGVRGFRIGRLEHMERFVEDLKAKVPVSPTIKRAWMSSLIAMAAFICLMPLLLGLTLRYVPMRCLVTLWWGFMAGYSFFLRPFSSTLGRRWDIVFAIFSIAMAVVWWLMD